MLRTHSQREVGGNSLQKVKNVGVFLGRKSGNFLPLFPGRLTNCILKHCELIHREKLEGIPYKKMTSIDFIDGSSVVMKILLNDEVAFEIEASYIPNTKTSVLRKTS